MPDETLIGYEIGDEAMEILDDQLEDFADQFPHLRRLVHVTLDAAARRYASAEDELSRIGELALLEHAVDAALASHVQWCREILRYSWVDIGAQLGCSRQAARQRFAAAADANTPESDRLVAEADYLVAKMQADALKAVMEDRSPTDVMRVNSADFERYLEIGKERHRLAQEALEDSNGEDVRGKR